MRIRLPHPHRSLHPLYRPLFLRRRCPRHPRRVYPHESRPRNGKPNGRDVRLEARALKGVADDGQARGPGCVQAAEVHEGEEDVMVGV